MDERFFERSTAEVRLSWLAPHPRASESVGVCTRRWSTRWALFVCVCVCVCVCKQVRVAGEVGGGMGAVYARERISLVLRDASEMIATTAVGQ